MAYNVLVVISHHTHTLTHTHRDLLQHVPAVVDPVHREVLHTVTVPLHKSFTEEGKAFLQADSQVLKHYKTWK